MSIHFLTTASTSPWTAVGIGGGITSSSTNTITISSSSLSNGIIRTYYDDSGYITSNSLPVEELARDFGVDVQNRKINAKHGWLIETPDGTTIKVDNNGNIEIKDDNAKIIYKANRIREFNRFLNASDLLEDFIRFIGSKGVKQNEVLNIPIEVFINWLIIEAAKEDGEEPPMLPLNNKEYPRCLTCGRFIKKSLAQVAKFCNPDHYSQYLLKL